MEGVWPASYHPLMLVRVLFWVAMILSAICAIVAAIYLVVGPADVLTSMVFGFIPAMVVNWFGWSARCVHHSDATIAPPRPSHTSAHINEARAP
jgi:hypothetical protein